MSCADIWINFGEADATLENLLMRVSCIFLKISYQMGLVGRKNMASLLLYVVKLLNLFSLPNQVATAICFPQQSIHQIRPFSPLGRNFALPMPTFHQKKYFFILLYFNRLQFRSQNNRRKMGEIRPLGRNFAIKGQRA